MALLFLYLLFWRKECQQLCFLMDCQTNSLTILDPCLQKVLQMETPYSSALTLAFSWKVIQQVGLCCQTCLLQTNRLLYCLNLSQINFLLVLLRSSVEEPWDFTWLGGLPPLWIFLKFLIFFTMQDWVYYLSWHLDLRTSKAGFLL